MMVNCRRDSKYVASFDYRLIRWCTVGLVITGVKFFAVSLSDVLRQLLAVYIFAVGGVRLCIK